MITSARAPPLQVSVMKGSGEKGVPPLGEVLECPGLKENTPRVRAAFLSPGQADAGLPPPGGSGPEAKSRPGAARGRQFLQLVGRWPRASSCLHSVSGERPHHLPWGK